MPLVIERVMRIHRGIEVGIGFIVAHGAPEELSPFDEEACATFQEEPLPLSATARTILTGAMGVDLNRDHALRERFLPGVGVDLTS